MAMSKNWCFTVYSPEVVFFDHSDIQYIIYGNEVCPKTGRPHKQGYVQFIKRMRLTGVKKLDSSAHWEIAKGTPDENVTYCSKEGDVHQRGDMIVTGHRSANEFKTVVDYVRKRKFDELEEHQYFGTYIRYKRTFDSMLKFDVAELDTPRGYWIYGKPGTGKDSTVMDLKPYVKPHNKWWDGYAGEEYVLLSDFTHKDADHLYTYLLQWADRYPFLAEVKGSSIKISPKRFYVTSNYSLHDIFGVYDRYDAFMRRFHVINYDEDQVTHRPIMPVVKKPHLVDF